MESREWSTVIIRCRRMILPCGDVKDCIYRALFLVAFDLHRIHSTPSFTNFTETSTIGVSIHTSLGLGQGKCPALRWSWQLGQLPGALKNGITFFAQIKSSSLVKYEYIHPLSHYLRIQSLKFGIKFGIGHVDARTSTYERSDLLQ